MSRMASRYALPAKARSQRSSRFEGLLAPCIDVLPAEAVLPMFCERLLDKMFSVLMSVKVIVQELLDVTATSKLLPAALLELFTATAGTRRIST